MRNYANIPNNFWTSKQGRVLREAGISAQMVSLYLLTNSHATYTCIYYLPVAYISADIGLSPNEVCEALASIKRSGFAHYDENSECVWVVDGAKWQIGESLKPSDKRVPYIQKEFDAIPVDCPFTQEFLDKYGKAFHLRSTDYRTQAKLLVEGEAPVVKKGDNDSTLSTKVAETAEKQSPASNYASLRLEQLFMSNLKGFQKERYEKGLSTQAGDKRIEDAAMSLAHQVGHLAAANALYEAHTLGDYDFTDLGQYVRTQDREAYELEQRCLTDDI